MSEHSQGGVSDVAGLLSKVPLFRALNAASVSRIAEVAREVSYGRGDVIFREGEIGDELYVVVEGEVRISRNAAGMGEEAIAVLGVGESFGEMSIMDDFPRSADAIANAPCKLLAVSREAFEDLLFLYKDIAYEVLWNVVKILSSRLRETNEKMMFMTVTGKFE